MMNPFDYRDLMKAHMKYNEDRTVEQILADQKARDDAPDDGRPVVSKTPPPPGRAPTMSELDAARALMNRGSQA